MNLDYSQLKPIFDELNKQNICFVLNHALKLKRRLLKNILSASKKGVPENGESIIQKITLLFPIQLQLLFSIFLYLDLFIALKVYLYNLFSIIF